MSSPRRYYRAMVSVVPLDPTTSSLLATMPDDRAVRALDLRSGVAEQAADTDIMLFATSQTRDLQAQPLIDEARKARASGLLVTAVVLGPAAAFRQREPEERKGLAFLREAADTLVMVRDEQILADILDVLRGGSREAVV